MKNVVDLAVRSADHQTKLIVEITAKREITSDWAVKLRRNVMAHGLPTTSSYFLLASPNRFYLWNKDSALSFTKAPDYEFDPEPMLKPYLKYIQSSLSELSQTSFDILVSTWLSDLTTPGPGTFVGSGLLESGLLDEIKNGSVEVETSF